MQSDIQKLLDEAQWLADDAKDISDRISDLGNKDTIPINAIAEDIAQLMYKLARLRLEIINEFNSNS